MMNRGAGNVALLMRRLDGGEPLPIYDIVSMPWNGSGRDNGYRGEDAIMLLLDVSLSLTSVTFVVVLRTTPPTSPTTPSRLPPSLLLPVTLSIRHVHVPDNPSSTCSPHVLRSLFVEIREPPAAVPNPQNFCIGFWRDTSLPFANPSFWSNSASKQHRSKKNHRHAISRKLQLSQFQAQLSRPFSIRRCGESLRQISSILGKPRVLRYVPEAAIAPQLFEDDCAM